MVIFYNLESKEIKRIEENVMSPILPLNLNLDEKIKYFSNENEGFICLPYELGNEIWEYKLIFNESDTFLGLQPR